MTGEIPEVPDPTMLPELVEESIDPYLRLMRESQVRQVELDRLKAELKELAEKNVPVIQALQRDVLQYAELAATRLQDARRERQRVVILAVLMTKLLVVGDALLNIDTALVPYDRWAELSKEAREVLAAGAFPTS